MPAIQDIPRLEIPLHTLIELTPKPDGTMAEERIPLDVKGSNPEDLAIHLQKRMNLQSGPYATPMTPFSPFQEGSNSPFSRVDSMGMGLDQLPTVSSIYCFSICCLANKSLDFFVSSLHVHEATYVQISNKHRSYGIVQSSRNGALFMSLSPCLLQCSKCIILCMIYGA